MGGRRRVPIKTKEIHEQINWKIKNIPSAVSAFQILHCDKKEAVPQPVALGYVCDYKSKTLFEQAVLHTSHHHPFVLGADYSTACEGILKTGGLSWRKRVGPHCLRNCCSSLHHAEETKLTEVWKLLLPPASRGMRDLLVLEFSPLPGSSKWWAVSCPGKHVPCQHLWVGCRVVLP